MQQNLQNALLKTPGVRKAVLLPTWREVRISISGVEPSF
jgi:hypothetical protein